MSHPTSYTMLSPLDDYPVHQVAEPVRRVATSDRNFYDRYYFNCMPVGPGGEKGDGDDEVFLVMGLDEARAAMWGIVDSSCRFEVDGQVGHGLFEYLFL